jgi:hypothetical protein
MNQAWFQYKILPPRAAKDFSHARKIIRCSENILVIMPFVAGHFLSSLLIFDIIHSAFRAFTRRIATAARAIHRADVGRSVFRAGLLLCGGFPLGTCILGSAVFAATSGNHQREGENQ